MISVKTEKEIALMRKASELTARAVELAGKEVKAGMSTYELDKIIHDFIVGNGGRPSSLGYCGFTGSACISVNEELIHGIPSKKKIIRDGDIVSVDITAEVDGFNGDSTKTFRIGKVSDAAERLLKVTEQALYEGIKQAVAGNRIGDISHAIQKYVEDNGYYIVKQYIGHGIGRDMHEDPEVPNFGNPGRGPRLVPGMTIAIEPMVNSSTREVKVKPDGWTVVEANGNLSAHFEHTVLITSGEPLIMTQLR